MSKMSKIKKDFLSAMKESGKDKTKPYDTSATVTRIEGKTAWVHINGGIDETPVQLTIDAKAGDTVKVRVSGGQAWLTGNGTAPPTDDTTATVAKVEAKKANVLADLAKKTADQAGKTATNYLSWSSDYGLIVSEDATEDVTEMTGGSTRVTSEGVSIYKGLIRLAMFGATVLIGRATEYAVEIAASAVSFIKNNTVVAKLYQDTGETVLEDYDSKNKLILGTGGMRLCDDQGQGLTVSGGIATAENLPAMTECGEITTSNVASHDYADYQVTFNKTFSSAPVVVVGMMSASTAYGVGSVSVSAHSITATGFTARIFNDNTSARSPYIHWIAMEQ